MEFLQKLKAITDNNPKRIEENELNLKFQELCKKQAEEIKEKILEAAKNGDRSFFINMNSAPYYEEKTLDLLKKEGISFLEEEDEFGPTGWFEFNW